MSALKKASKDAIKHLKSDNKDCAKETKEHNKLVKDIKVAQRKDAKPLRKKSK